MRYKDNEKGEKAKMIGRTKEQEQKQEDRAVFCYVNEGGDSPRKSEKTERER